jgi:phytoene dehydrogenase-like protein
MRGCTLKMNVWLKELPNFRARPGTLQPHHYGQINTPLSKQEWKDGYAAARAGKLPQRLWTELYFQSVHDSTVAPPGTHTMSVFSQYVPYTFAKGGWNQHREAAKRLGLEALAHYCSNMPEAVIDCEALGPPDIEERVGLSGGHIFQGECLPDYMWSNRLSYRTPMPGFYLCGAATHPGGSVIAINGRNAAMAVIADSRRGVGVSAAD